MDTIEFEGKKYRRCGTYWIYNNEAVCKVLERKLNAAFEKTRDINSLNFEELITKGGFYERNGDPSLGASYFQKALTDFSQHNDIKTVLPNLCRCYHRLNQFPKIIELFEKYGKDEKYISEDFFDYVGSAYYQLGDKDKAWYVLNLTPRYQNGPYSLLYFKLKKIHDGIL